MLKQLQVDRAPKRDRPYKLHDRDGLYLYVGTRGTKSWRYDFRFPATTKGARHTLTYGLYDPAEGLTIAQARVKHTEARRQLKEGNNPALLKQTQKRALSDETAFKAIAEEWYEGVAPGRSKSWKENVRRWLEKRIYPEIGSSPIREIEAASVLAIMKSIQREGKARSAEYVRRLIAQVFDHAVKNLRANFNPAQSLKGAITAPPVKSHPRLSEKELPAFLKKIDAFKGDQSIRLAVKLLLLTFTRKQELTGAQWAEIDLNAKEWKIPADRMKSRREHLVPLSTQAVEAFREIHKISKRSDFVFPSPYKKKKPIGRELLNKAFRSMGYKQFTPHGIRSTASTILNERSGFPGDIIETALAHVERDKVRAVYNYAQWIEQRRKLMQFWADTLDSLQSGGKVVPIRGKRA